MKEIPMTLFKNFTKTAVLLSSIAGLSQAVDKCNIYSETMEEDYTKGLCVNTILPSLASVIEAVHDADVSCLLDITNYTAIDGVDSPNNSLHKMIENVFIEGVFSNFYVPYPNGNFTRDWENKKISAHLGLGVFVNISKYDAERMVPQITNYERLNNRSILLKLTDKGGNNTPYETFYYLAVHLLEDSSRVKDVFTPLASDLSNLRSRLKAPLLISGNFGREIGMLSKTMINAKIFSVNKTSLNNGAIVLL